MGSRKASSRHSLHKRRICYGHSLAGSINEIAKTEYGPCPLIRECMRSTSRRVCHTGAAVADERRSRQRCSNHDLIGIDDSDNRMPASDGARSGTRGSRNGNRICSIDALAEPTWTRAFAGV